VQDLMLFQLPLDFEHFMASNASKGRGLWCAVVLAHVYKFQLIQTGEGFVTDWTREPADQNSKTTTVNVRWAALCCRKLSYSLLTYSMEQSPSSEANQFSASQEIHHIYGTTSAHHLSLS